MRGLVRRERNPKSMLHLEGRLCETTGSYVVGLWDICTKYGKTNFVA